MQEQFLATVVDPVNYNVLPPNVNNINSFTKDLSIYATTTGLTNATIIWLPERSASSIFTLVPANGTSSNVNCTSTGNFTVQGTTALNYPSGFFIATVSGYNFMYEKQQVNISPDIGAAAFTAYRSYAGQLTAKSDTTSTGTAAITGELHAASISDIRGLRQLKVVDLVQQTTTKKDAVWSQKVYDGVVVNIGSDIPSQYIAPSASRVDDDSYSGIGSLFPATGTNRGLVGPRAAYYSEIAFFAPGITKGAIPGSYGANFYDTLGSNYQTLDDFAWFDCVDYDVYYSMKPVAGPNVTQPNIQCSDIFGVLDAAGNISNVRVARTYYQTGWYPNAAAGVVPGNAGIYMQQIHHRCPLNVFQGESLPPSVSDSFTWMETSSTQRMQYFGTAFSFPEGWYYQVVPIARSIYRRGNCGPARIIQWQNVAAGQNMEIRGILRTQIVATGAVAPYTTSAGETQSVNASLIPFLANIYNGPSTIFKRVYGGAEFSHLAKTINKDLKALFHQKISGLPEEVHIEGKAAGLGDLFARGGRFLAQKVGKHIPSVTAEQGEQLGNRVALEACKVACKPGPGGVREWLGQKAGSMLGKNAQVAVRHMGNMACDIACPVSGRACAGCGGTCGAAKKRGRSAPADNGRVKPTKYKAFRPWQDESEDPDAQYGVQ